MRETGKTKKIKGYRESITYGFNKYKRPDSYVEGYKRDSQNVATLVEMIPEHTPCNICKKLLSNKEIDMATCMISCDHKDLIKNKINERIMTFECEECGGAWTGKPNDPYWTPAFTQENICFECYGDIYMNEYPEIEVCWYGIR